MIIEYLRPKTIKKAIEFLAKPNIVPLDMVVAHIEMMLQ